MKFKGHIMRSQKNLSFRSVISRYANTWIEASWSGDQVNGKKGTARVKSGAKHYLRSRIRCKENSQLQKEIKKLVF